MASLTYYAKDEYGNDVTVRLPDWTGHLLLATTDEPPEGTLIADGSAVSRAVYHELFEKIGTRYGAGDGVSTFTLPDWRDEFPRFSGAERAVGSKQSDAIREIIGRMDFRPGEQGSNVVYGMSYAFDDNETSAQSVSVSINTGQMRTCQGIVFRASNVVPTADENRPRNIAFLPCIIYV